LAECKGCGRSVGERETFCSACGRKLDTVQAKSGSGLKWLGAIVLIIVLGNVIQRSAQNANVSAPTPGDTGTPVDKRTPKEMALNEVKLNFTWRKEADVLMKANFTIKNDSVYTVKDLEIKCVHFAPSGTQIDSNTRTIYEIVRPHSKRSFPDFDMGFIHSQASRTNCQIQDLAVVE
jgi:hypothetical protein